MNVHNSAFFSPLSPSPSHARSCHKSECAVKSCNVYVMSVMYVLYVLYVMYVLYVLSVTYVMYIMYVMYVMSVMYCHARSCHVISCAAMSCSSMCINTCSGSVILSSMIRCFGYPFKLAWLVLGGDSAARSHRVEQAVHCTLRSVMP